MLHSRRVRALMLTATGLLATSCSEAEGVEDGATCSHAIAAQEAKFPRVSIDPAQLKVIDGDSLRLGDEEIRLLGIDAPEAPSDFFHGSQEPHASRAREFVQSRIREATTACIVRLPEKDTYHRTLAYVFLGDENLNAEIVRAGLAYENLTFYGHQALRAYAEQVMDASRVAPLPEFEAPHLFRRRNTVRRSR